MIGTTLQMMLTKWLAMKRWNNYPRVEDISHMDHIGFVIHVSLFLAYLEEKQGNKVDREFLLKRIIFQSFSKLVLSDISSGTRDYIMRFDAEIFAKIEKKSLDAILQLEAPEYIKIDIKNILNDTQHTLEHKIISAAKEYSAYRECLVNQKVFEDMYEVPFRSIQKQLEQLRGELRSFDVLLGNDNYIKFLSHIRRLSHSMRWNQERRIYPISVMSHLVIITYIVYIIGMIENHSGKNYDLEELMLRTIYHDIPEAITGDIITPTKKSVEWFDTLLERVEIQMMDDYIFSYVWEDYKQEVFEYMLHPFEWELGRIWKQADIISALLEAKIEVNNGSQNFHDIYRRIKKKVNSFDSISVAYILKHGLDSFDDQVEISL